MICFIIPPLLVKLSCSMCSAEGFFFFNVLVDTPTQNTSDSKEPNPKMNIAHSLKAPT